MRIDDNGTTYYEPGDIVEVRSVRPRHGLDDSWVFEMDKFLGQKLTIEGMFYDNESNDYVYSVKETRYVFRHCYFKSCCIAAIEDDIEVSIEGLQDYLSKFIIDI